MRFRVVFRQGRPGADCAVSASTMRHASPRARASIDRLAGGRLAALGRGAAISPASLAINGCGDLGSGAHPPARSSLDCGGKGQFISPVARRALIGLPGHPRTGARHANLALAASPSKASMPTHRAAWSPSSPSSRSIAFRSSDSSQARTAPTRKRTLPSCGMRSPRGRPSVDRPTQRHRKRHPPARDLGTCRPTCAAPGYLVGAARALGKRFVKLKLTIHGPAEYAATQDGAQFRAGRQEQRRAGRSHRHGIPWRAQERGAGSAGRKGITFDIGAASRSRIRRHGRDENFDMCAQPAFRRAHRPAPDLRCRSTFVGDRSRLARHMPDGRP